MDGKGRASHAAAFADAVRAVVAVPVVLQDERLSTMEASEGLRDAGASAKRRRAVIDASAAQVMLQAWLDVEQGRRGAGRSDPGPGYPHPRWTTATPPIAETDATSERRRRRWPRSRTRRLLRARVAWRPREHHRRCGADPAAAASPPCVPEGHGQEVVQQLADPGLIHCGGFVGNLLLRGTGQATAILAGSYDVPVGSSLDQILALMTTPPQEVRTERATIPEGLRIHSTFPGERSTSSVIEQQTGVPASVFAKLAESGRYTLPPYLPKGRSAERFLFPDTYEFVRKGLDADAIIRRMLEQFDTEATDLDLTAGAKALG
jgi:hypothetical protein